MLEMQGRVIITKGESKTAKNQRINPSPGLWTIISENLFRFLKVNLTKFSEPDQCTLLKSNVHGFLAPENTKKSDVNSSKDRKKTF